MGGKTGVNPLGEYLRWIRLRADLSLRQAQKATDINYSSISRFEGGGRPPSPLQLRKLALAYDVDVTFVLIRAGYLELPGFDEMRGDSEDERLASLLELASLDEKRELVRHLVSLRLTGPLVDQMLIQRTGRPPGA